MTSPNLGPESLDDFTNAANAMGLAALQHMNAQDIIQSQIDGVSSKLGGIAEWILDGISTVISDIQAYVTTGDVANLEAAAEYVQSKLLGFAGEFLDMLTGLLEALLGTYAGDDAVLQQIKDLFAPLRTLLTLLTGAGSAEDATSAGVLGWFNNLRELLAGGEVGADPSGWFDGLESLAANFTDLLAALQGDYAGSDPVLSAIQSWASALGNLDAAVDAAVEAVKDAVQEIISGSIVSDLAAAVYNAVQEVIDTLFGSGGSTWTQEVYFTSSQLQIGPNDIPLGFRMGYAGRITNIYVRVLANNATSGSAIIQVRKNASSFTSITLSTTDTSKSANANVTCNAGDIIDFNCTQVPSAGTIAGISISVIGRYN